MLDVGKRLTDELSDFGRIIDVPCDVSCGYYSIYLCPQAISKANLLESTEVSHFRIILWDHAKKSYDGLINNEAQHFFLTILKKEKSNGIERYYKKCMIQILIIKMMHLIDCGMTAH